MAETTGIGWCDHTFNPWWGCEKVSPACARCYAEEWSDRHEGPGLWGEGHTIRLASEAYWEGPLKWNRDAERGVLTGKGLGRRHRVFCLSMGDLFEELEMLEPHRRRVFDVIEATPYLDWQLLTKRPEFARDWLRSQYAPFSGYAYDEHGKGIPPNIWMGVSIENQAWTWRADVLREIPAAVRFISAEPLLASLLAPREEVPTLGDGVEPVDPGRTPGTVSRPGPSASRGASRNATASGGPCNVPADDDAAAASFVAPLGALSKAPPSRRGPLDLDGVDWLIAGGESGGRDARPMHPDWARQLRDECAARGVAFYFKQWGSYAPTPGRTTPLDVELVGGARVKYHGVGPTSGGKILDGVEHCEFPASAPYGQLALA